MTSARADTGETCKMVSFLRRRRLTVLFLAILGVAFVFYLISYFSHGVVSRGDSIESSDGRHLSWRSHRHHGTHHRRKRPHHSVSHSEILTKFCKVPRLSLRHDENKALFHTLPALSCSGQDLWYVRKSVLHINRSVESAENLLKCDYRAIEWTKDTQHTYSTTLQRVSDFEIKVHHDFLRVQCYLKPSKTNIENYHARKLLMETVQKRPSKHRVKNAAPLKHDINNVKPHVGHHHENVQQKSPSDYNNMHHRPNAFGSMGMPDPPVLISRAAASPDLNKQIRKLIPKANSVKNSHKKAKSHVLPRRSVPLTTLKNTIAMASDMPKTKRQQESANDVNLAPGDVNPADDVNPDADDVNPDAEDANPDADDVNADADDVNPDADIVNQDADVQEKDNEREQIHVSDEDGQINANLTNNQLSTDAEGHAETHEKLTEETRHLPGHLSSRENRLKNHKLQKHQNQKAKDIMKTIRTVNTADQNNSKKAADKHKESQKSQQAKDQQLNYEGRWLAAPEYDQFIAQIYPREEVYARVKEIEVATESSQMSVLVFVIDALSHLSWQRKLPKTYSFLTQTLKAEVMKGYNVVGDDSPAALIPLLTGKFESELPKVQKNAAGSTYIDSFPLLWNQFEQSGYVTLFAEDQPHIAAFNLRYNGFEYKPTDHYMRTFWQAADNSDLNQKSPKFCLGSKPKHKYLLEYLRQFFLKYRNIPRFALAFHGELSHLDNNPAEHMDADLTHFLEVLKNSGVLDDTLLVFMSDHGARVGKSRGSIQGKLEQRLPFLSLVFPPKFKAKYEENMKILKHNAYRLTTPFDLHATLLDLLDVTRLTEPVKFSDRSVSLLREVPLNRTCASAAIHPQWCSCLTWQEQDRQLTTSVTAATELVSKMNSMLKPVQHVCAQLSLKTIVDAKIALPNEKVIHIGKKVDPKQHMATFSDDLLRKLEVIYYQVIIQTSPNMAVYEATLQYIKAQEKFTLSDDISRLDLYGKQPSCIMEKFAGLMKFCQCI